MPSLDDNRARKAILKTKLAWVAAEAEVDIAIASGESANQALLRFKWAVENAVSCAVDPPAPVRINIDGTPVGPSPQEFATRIRKHLGHVTGTSTATPPSAPEGASMPLTNFQRRARITSALMGFANDPASLADIAHQVVKYLYFARKDHASATDVLRQIAALTDDAELANIQEAAAGRRLDLNPDVIPWPERAAAPAAAEVFDMGELPHDWDGPSEHQRAIDAARAACADSGLAAQDYAILFLRSYSTALNVIASRRSA